jgi:hypothetical protein
LARILAISIPDWRPGPASIICGVMSDEPSQTVDEAPVARVLTPAAQRALAEAEERRRLAAEAERPAEDGGPAGPEPTRYGDWERKGLAVDF